MSFLRRDKSKLNVRLSFGHPSEQPGAESEDEKTEVNVPRSDETSRGTDRINENHTNNDFNNEQGDHKDKNGTCGKDFYFNSKYDENYGNSLHNMPSTMSQRNREFSTHSAENHSPRSSISMTKWNKGEHLDGANDEESHIKDNYKGLHGNRRPKGANIPPLLHPIKPRFPKKNGSLLGKLIHANRKDSESSNHTDNSEEVAASDKSRKNSTAVTNLFHSHPGRKSGGSGGSTVSSGYGNSSESSKTRVPSLSLDHNYHAGSLDGTISPLNQTHKSSYDDSIVDPRNFLLDMNMDIKEMQGIVKSPGERIDDSSNRRKSFEAPPKVVPPLRKAYSTANSLSTQDLKHSWKAPDSWDVKVDKLPVGEKSDLEMLSDSDSEGNEKYEFNKEHLSVSPASLSPVTSSEDNENSENVHRIKRPNELKSGEEIEMNQIRSRLPILFGQSTFSHNNNQDGKSGKGPNHICRVFKEDNTFTTILCPLETTTSELLHIVQRKFFLDSMSNYQLSVYIGNCVKVLEPYEKPLVVQMGLLMLSGYTDNDNLKLLGREDLSFVCKFVVENIYLRNLTHEEETVLSKDYVDVNISGLNLKNIPIIFHQHTYEIEKLNVANNPSIYIPLDFIHSCNNLTSIDFSRNSCSKFPMNFLEAKKLTDLDLQKNFLHDLPSKFSHLKCLTHLNLSSNQLTHLPKSFGKLQSLVVLNLSSNYFNFYPEPVSELINLTDLDLSYNDLWLLPNSISKLSKLSKLNLCTNKLSKRLPDHLSSLVSLKRLDIRYNQITEVDVLGSLPNLEVAYSSKNNISKFSDEMASLRLLHFDRNPITNLEFRKVLPKLTVLDLAKAKLTSIPSDFISKIPNIEKLVLDKNHLVDLPNEIGLLSRLTFLSLHNNNLQVLPSSIGDLTALQYLDLHSNNLQELPNEIWYLRSLSVLNVCSNILSSFPKPPLSIAKTISSSANLKDLLLISNDDTSRQKSINSSTENTSEELKDMDGFSSTSNSSNLGSGTISLGNSLLVLTMADNRLSDDCFNSLSFLIELKSLNLSYNEILEIPEGALSRLLKLTDLYLSGNELAILPTDDLENLKALKSLFLNNNKLVSLPAEISKLENLQILDVGSNQLKYNISNWPYDWNWHWNKNLKYLNFSGNKRFEIKQSHVKNPETGEDFDSLLVLKNLRVLGLIDVTITSSLVPDQSRDTRIRTTSSELDNIGYGISDCMGMRENVSNRDIFIQKFRGNENEILLCSFDGINGPSTMGHRVSSLARSILVSIFTNELNKLTSDETIQDAIRRTFLTMNKQINGVLSAKKSNSFASAPQTSQEFVDLDVSIDGDSGCAITIIYIKDKKLYTGNIGDIEALLLRTNGNHTLLTNKHEPTNRVEFERIRASGGYMSSDGTLDGSLSVSRGVGFFNYLPHTHSGPDITEISLTSADDMIVMATKVLWEYVSYELAVDILRQEKSDPMIAAQKLRDYAISYGATDKLAVIVLTLGQQKKKSGFNNLYNLGRDNDVFASKKRRDKAQTGDSNLRRLEEEIDPPVGELALVFTDIKNSTLLWDAYPVPMRSAIKTHNSIMRRQLRIVGGYEVKTEGDAFMVSFPTPTSALLWCFNVQQQLLTADWPTEILQTNQCCEVADNDGNIIFRGLSVRMGMHWGSPVCEPDIVTGRMDYFGPMVNRASRINAIADGGQIAISQDFLGEIRGLFKIHDSIADGSSSISESFQGNIVAGEIIEREINSIEENGISYFDIGEKKLKGLEIPELVTLIYPKPLSIRFEIFSKGIESSETDSNSKIVGVIPMSSIYSLRDISLRLENLCSALNGGLHINEGFQRNSSTKLSTFMPGLFKEQDFIALLSHIVTRIENCTAILELRQELSEVKGNGKYIDFGEVYPISDMMNEFASILKTFKDLQKTL